MGTLHRHYKKGKDRRASKRKHQYYADLISCEVLDAVATAAMAADLGLDFCCISVSLTGCSDGRSWPSSSLTPRRAIYVSGVAELTVELRPADEWEPATMFVYSAKDSDITVSSVDDVGDVHCRGKACNDVGDSSLSATFHPFWRPH